MPCSLALTCPRRFCVAVTWWSRARSRLKGFRSMRRWLDGWRPTGGRSCATLQVGMMLAQIGTANGTCSISSRLPNQTRLRSAGDGCNRVPLHPVHTRTGRNQPQAGHWILGVPRWLRHVVRPEPEKNNGADGGTRTPTPLRETDFKSVYSLVRLALSIT